MKKSPVFLFSILYLALLLLASLTVSLFSNGSWNDSSMGEVLLTPNFHHWLGTDSLGRDLLLRILHGTQASLLTALLAMVVALFIGASLGVLSGWWGGIRDQALMRFVEVFLSFPQIVFISLILITIRKQTGSLSQTEMVASLVLAQALTSWMIFARIARNLVLQEKNKTYIEAATALGGTSLRILWYHILPNIFSTLVVFAGLQVSNYILFESFLSFVGVGFQPPLSSWGLLIQEGWRTLSVYPHLILAPSAVLFLTILSLNLIFESLLLRLNPKLKHHQTLKRKKRISPSLTT